MEETVLHSQTSHLKLYVQDAGEEKRKPLGGTLEF